MKILKRRIISLVLAVMLVSVLAPSFFISASAGDTIITGYGTSKAKIYENDTVNITVYLKSLSLKSGADVAKASDIDITRRVDSFYGGGEPVVSVTSANGSLLTYKIVFPAVSYRGVGDTFSFIVTYNENASESETLELAASECVPSSETTAAETTAAETTAAETMPPWETTTRESITEPEKPAKEQAAPLVAITRSAFPKEIKPGMEFNLNVIIKNTGSPYTISTGAVSFEPSEGLELNENSSSKSISDIRANSSKTVTVKLRAVKSVENSSQSVNVSFRYYYQSGEGAVMDTSSEKIIIPIAVSDSKTTTESAAKATPNIIVSKYDYGGKPIAAGSSFNLELSFRNTSKSLKVENLVMSVETGEGLSIASSSNTYYYDSIAAGKSESRGIKMNVTANALSGGSVVDISFRYEYVDNGTRGSGSSNERLYVPVYLPDRFIITAPDTIYAVANEELSLSLPYVNKSKGAVNNVEAELIFDEADGFCEFPKMNLGNFEPGKSGTIDLFITPNTAETMTVTVLVSYETESGELKKVSVPLTFTPDEGMMDDPGFMEPDFPTDIGESSGKLKFIIIAAVVIAAIVVFIVLRRRKKKKSKIEISSDFDWNMPQPAETAGNSSDRNETKT